MVGAFTAMGINSSGVREIAEANGKADPVEVARTILTLRRACWVTGVFGCFLTIALSYPLSLWIFSAGERALPIALLGITLLLGSISGGQKALLQGVRRIGDLAQLSVLSAIVGTVVAVGFYTWLGERGIVPVLITIAAFNLATSWWFARKVEVVTVTQSFTETWQKSQQLVSLGLAFMWSGLLAAAVPLVIRSLIIRQLGIDAGGVYHAAWAISGMFAGFILGAMSADFYPRLTAVADDNAAVNRLVNEQTEIGILLALPGILGVLTFATWMMQLFYSAKFIPGADLLPYFALGVFGRVICWPMGFIQLAKGASRWFVATQSIFHVMHLALSILFLHWLDLRGVALAFVAMYGLHLVGLRWVAGCLSNFCWTHSVLRLLIVSTSLVAGGFFFQHWLPGMIGLTIGGILTAVSCIFSLRGIACRLGGQHRLVRLACRLPGGRCFCGI